jgi:tape measure domain-containing protein
MSDGERTTWELDFPDNGSLDRITDKVNRLAAKQDQLNNVAKCFLGIGAETENSVKKTAKGFDIFDAAMAKATRSSQSFGQEHTSLTTKTGDLTAKLNTSATAFGFFASAGAAAFSTIKSSVESAIGALVEFDKHATTAFGERTSTLRAYTTILGDATQAQVEYGKANQLASMTELTSASTLKAQQALIVAGFRGEDLTKSLTASMDVAATKQPAEREMTMERMGRAFSQILAAGKLRGQELNQLAEAGVNRGQVLEILGKGDAGRGEKSISAGGVSAKEGIEAVYKSILSTLGTQKLGQFATGAAGSMAGELSNREEALDILLKSFDGETLPAVKRYTASLHEQNSMLSTNSENGKGLVMMLSDFASVTANVKTEWTDFTTAFMGSFVEAFNTERAVDGAFTPMTDGVKMLGETLGKVGTVVGQVTRAFESMLDAMQPALKFMSDPFGKEETKKELMGDLERQNPTRYKEIQARLDRGDTVEEATRFAGSGGKTAAEKAATEKQWLDFKQRQADGETDEDTIAMNKLLAKKPGNGARVTHWPSGGAGASGAGGRKKGDGIALDFGSSGGDSWGGADYSASAGVGASSSTQESLRQAVHAAGQASSAPSSQAQTGSSASAGSMTVHVDQIDIAVSGAGNARETAEEVWRVFTQRAGRLTRSPGVGRF